MRNLFISFLFLGLAACNSSSDSTKTGSGVSDLNILDGSQATYTELNEEGNSTTGTYEDTAYTLDANGLEISGNLAENSLGSTGDVYVFYSGSSNKIDLQVFLNGVGLENDTLQVNTFFDALNPDGVSLLISSSFRAIPIFADTYYRITIGVNPSDNSALNKPYVIQIKASSN